MKHFTFALLMTLVFSEHLFTQGITLNISASAELMVCDDPGLMTMTINNNSGNNIANPDIEIALPQGIDYQIGSISNITNHNVTAVNTSNNSQLSFSANQLNHGDSIVFSINYVANQSAITHQNNGNIFRNQLKLIYNGNNTTKQSNSYNILYPALSILQASPTSQTILSGGQTNRSIHIINGGNGRASEIYITDVFNSAVLNLSSVNIGQISGDTIILSGNDFNSIGNFDNYFDQNESITIIETLSGTSCQDVTITSDIKAHWGCESSKLSSESSYCNVSIDFQTPSLKLIPTSSISNCFGPSESSEQTLAITNIGDGISSNLFLEIFKSSGNGYDQSIYSKFDETSFDYKIGSNGSIHSISNLTAHAVTGTNAYACLGNAPTGKVDISLPNLSPSDTIYIKWNTYACCISECNNSKIMGWEADLSYTDICNANSYQKTTIGQGINKQQASFTTETPTDLVAGQAKDFTFIVSSFQNTLPQGNGAHYVAKFTLDHDLNYNSISFGSNGIYWVPFSVNYDTTNRILVAKYTATAPFIIPKSEINLSVFGLCGNEGWKTIDFEFSYVADTTCTNGICQIPLQCNKQVSTYLHCPNNNCASLNVFDFSVSRINYGEPDNNLDGNPDVSGQLNFSAIKTNRAMVGDTIQSISKAVIGATNNTWSYLAFESDIDFGASLSYLNAEIKVYDASNAVWESAAGMIPVQSINQNSAFFSFDLSSSALAVFNNYFSNYQFSENDSIEFNVKYRVSSSVPNLLQETTFLNDFYLSQVSQPNNSQKEKCSFRHGRITLIGYSWRNNSSNNYTVNTCSKVMTQNFGMSIGDESSNYAGGNLFPFEYRHWGIIKDAYVVIPKNYTHVNTSIRYFRTKKTNSKISKTVNNLLPDQISGDTLFYDISQYYNANQLFLGDDGFNGKLQVEIAPNCSAAVNTYENVYWYFNYLESSAINGDESGYISANSPDKIRFSPPNLELSSANPWQDANTKKVAWDLKIKNTSGAGADHNWVHIVSPQNITIDSIIDDLTGQLLAQQSDLYLVGTIQGGADSDLTIHGTFSGCDTVLFTVYSGAECSGYPSNFDSFSCNIESLVLYVEPKLSGYQTRIATQLMADPCDPEVEITVDITSVRIAHMYDMVIDFISPDTHKIAVLDESSWFKYNIANSFQSITDPTLTDSIYTYDLNSINPDFIVDGIPGVTDINNNRYQIKSTITLGPTFENDDYLRIQINGRNACGFYLPEVNLAYDPSSKFKKDNTSGLTLSTKNNWSGSWGDYDNDGFDDLFVPAKSLNETNTLYHNNQDGTFTAMSSSVITNDLGASVSGTWGDYDNDGFLDLFVANNENSANKLYHNNQNGTFTSIQNSPIVDLGIYTHAAAWADYNLDGHLDLVISDFHPTKFNYLFQGDGLGGFIEDKTSIIGQSASSAVGVAWADYDNDGDQDLFIANTNGEHNQLFINQSGVFTEELNSVVVTDGGSSVGGVWGDYDNDGDLDLYVTNSSVHEVNYFYENNGNGTFTKILNSIVTANPSTSHGASWIDYDNDGDLDLLVANDQNQSNFLFANNGNKTFTELSNAITEESGNSLGTAWADFDNDGDYDLFIANRDGNANDLFINEKGSCTNHVKVKLVGCNSNKFGVGALVKVKANIGGVDTWQTKHISTQTSAMGGQNSSTILFGLNTSNSIDSLIVLWPSGIQTIMENPAINQLITINEDCGSKICGTVFFDENDNGVRDPNEIGISNRTLLVTPGDFQITTSSDGTYELYLNDGEYTLSMPSVAGWNQTNPVNQGSYSLSINKSNTSIYCGNDFGVKASCTDPDLSITLGTTAFRRGLTNDLNVVVLNEGAYEATQTLTLQLEMSNDVYIIDSSWTNVTTQANSRTYEFILNPIDRFGDTVLYLTDSVSNNAALNSTVLLSGSISYGGNECDLTNNSASMTDIIVGSVDPNDKLVLVENVGSSYYVGLNDTILYKIRFQNIGTASARRVMIVDTLDPNLNWDSFEIVSSSHPFSVSLMNGVVTWVNPKIELPDSSSNPESSQGYVTFKICPKANCKPYEVIHNKASIQFDYNAFIITNNTEITYTPQYKSTSPIDVYLYPNPAVNHTTEILLLEDNIAVDFNKLKVLSLNGHEVESYSFDPLQRYILNTKKLNPGMYMIQLTAEDGKSYTDKLIVLI